MTSYSYSLQCMANSIMFFSDLRGSLFVWDVTFSFFLLHDGEVFESLSEFVLIF